MREIFIYMSIKSWLAEKPEGSLKGNVSSKGNGFIEIMDEHGYTQIINLSQVFAVVY